MLHEQSHTPAKTLLSTKVLLGQGACPQQVLRHTCQSCVIVLNTPGHLKWCQILTFRHYLEAIWVTKSFKDTL